MENKKSFGKILVDNLILALLVVLVIVTAIVEPKFLSSANISNLLGQLWPLPFIALGMTFVIIGGYIDLSVVGMISLSACITASLINPLGQVGAMFVGTLAGMAMGWITGAILVASGARIQAEVLFITYGMSSIWTAIGLLWTQGETIRIARATKPITLFEALGSGKIFGFMPIIVVVFVVILVLAYLFHTKTIWGRCISLMGGNREAAELSGYNMKRTMRMIYTISGLACGLGAISQVARVTIATASSGEGYETNAILCVVVGGTSLIGGRGNVFRTMLGVVLITLLGNCMNMLGLGTYMQTVMRGAVLVIAIWLDNRKNLVKQ